MAEELLDDSEFDLIEGPDEELATVLSELGADTSANVKVYRARKGTNKTAFLYECAPHEYSLEFIRDNYGSGDYRIMLRDGKRLLANKLISVEALPKLPGSQVSTEMGDTFKELMRMVSDQSTEHKKDLQAMQAQNQQMMLLMMSRMQGGGQQQMTPTDMINMVSALSGVFKGNSGPAADPMSMFNIFKQGLDMARDLNPDASTDTNSLLAKLVDQFGPIFQHAMTTPATQPAIGSPQTHALPHQPRQQMPAAGQQQQQTGGGDMNRMVQAVLRPKLRELAEVAARGGNIDLYTDLVLDQVPMGYISMLLEQPDPVAFLAGIEPAIEPHREWFQSLLTNIALVLREDESLTAETPNAIHPQTAEGEKPADALATVVEGQHQAE